MAPEQKKADIGRTVSQEAKWLMEPLQPGEVRIDIQVTEGANLTPQLRDALECLAKALNDEDMQRYAMRVAGTPLKVHQAGQLIDFDSVLGRVADCGGQCNNQCGQQCATSNGRYRILPVAQYSK